MDTSRPVDPRDSFSAKDLVIVITGGGSGIGLAFAAALAQSSARKIYLLGRRLQNLQEAATTINSSVITPVQCDVTSPGSISAAVKQVEQEVGYIDVSINNAGVEGPKHTDIYKAATISELQAIMLKDPEGWDTAYRTNTTAVNTVSASFSASSDAGNARRGWVQGKRTHQTRAEGADYDASDERTSQIITVTSISSFNRTVTAGSAYTASKAGATMSAKSMANFLAPWGIRSNVIAPGRFPSEMTAGAATEFPVDQVPAGKPGVYGDMAGTISYSVGKAGAYVNGNVQILDGGRLSVMPGTY